MTYETQPVASNDTRIEPSEDAIRLRSYQIWEREGRPQGCADEHWRRAKAELEAEMEEASMAGMAADIVLPRLPISIPPTKSVSVRIETDNLPMVAMGGKR
jgi:hypothetical protein